MESDKYQFAKMNNPLLHIARKERALFANVKRISLPETEYIDKAYHQKKYREVHSPIGTMPGADPLLVGRISFIAVKYKSEIEEENEHGTNME